MASSHLTCRKNAALRYLYQKSMNKRSQVLACVYVALLLQLARSVTIGGGKIGRILDINKQARTHLTPTLQCSDSGNPRELRSKDGALSSYRRKFLVSAMVWTLPIPLLLPPREALAALPITQGESENLGAKTFRFLRPKPPKVLRQRVSKDFAVLLMRSSYKTLDELDCVAMDQFQRDFFILRQAEYQPYVNALGPGMVTQGDLSDPYYFDFISFAQYLAINREISQDPPLIFEEQQPEDVGEDQPQRFVTKIVKRDPSITNDMLAPEHSRRVGEAILQYFDEKLGDTASSLPKIPAGSRPNADQVLASFTQLVKLFIINGYAWDGSAAIVSMPTASLDGGAGAAGAEFCLALVSPATIWSGQSLRAQRAELLNDYLRKAATALAKRLGYEVASSTVKYDGTNELSYLKLR